jgi:hypothetical protein
MVIKVDTGQSAITPGYITEHLTGAKDFRSDLEKLQKLQLVNDNGDKQPRAEMLLDTVKEYGVGYVKSIIDFNANRTKANARVLFEALCRLRDMISKVQGEFPEETAFARTSKRPLADKPDNIKAVEHIGTIMDSIFATFAGSTFYSEYANFETKFILESASRTSEKARSQGQFLADTAMDFAATTH